MNKLAQIHGFRKPVPVHVLKTRKIVEDVKENIVEQCVDLEVFVKLQFVISGRVPLILFVVEQASCTFTRISVSYEISYAISYALVPM